MCCIGCSLSSFISVCLNAFERMTVCTVCAILTFCLLFTILAALALGVGIGFHYCFVTQTVDVMSKAAKLTVGAEEGPSKSMLRSNMVRALDKTLNRGIGRARRSVDSLNQAASVSLNQTANVSLNKTGNVSLNKTGNVSLTQAANVSLNQTGNRALNQTAKIKLPLPSNLALHVSKLTKLSM